MITPEWQMTIIEMYLFREIQNPLKAGCNQLIQENKLFNNSCSDFLNFMNWNTDLIKKDIPKKTEKPIILR